MEWCAALDEQAVHWKNTPVVGVPQWNGVQHWMSRPCIGKFTPGGGVPQWNGVQHWMSRLCIGKLHSGGRGPTVERCAALDEQAVHWEIRFGGQGSHSGTVCSTG